MFICQHSPTQHHKIALVPVLFGIHDDSSSSGGAPVSMSIASGRSLCRTRSVDSGNLLQVPSCAAQPDKDYRSGLGSPHGAPQKDP